MTNEKTALLMKTMRQYSVGELTAMLADKKEQWRHARMKHACKQLRQTHVLLQLRRDIARLQCVIADCAAVG